MTLSKIYRKVHRQIEDNEDKKISHREMAKRLDCSIDAYGGHLRGTNEPKPVKQFINLIGMLHDDQLLSLLKLIREELNASQNS